MPPFVRFLPFLLSSLLIAFGLYLLGPQDDWFLPFIIVAPGLLFGLAGVIGTLGISPFHFGKAAGYIAISTGMHSLFWGGAYFTIGLAGLPLAALAGWLMALLTARMLLQHPAKGLGFAAIPGGLSWVGFYLGDSITDHHFFNGYTWVYLLWQISVGAIIIYLLYRKPAESTQA